MEINKNIYVRRLAFILSNHSNFQLYRRSILFLVFLSCFDDDDAMLYVFIFPSHCSRDMVGRWKWMSWVPRRGLQREKKLSIVSTENYEKWWYFGAEHSGASAKILNQDCMSSPSTFPHTWHLNMAMIRKWKIQIYKNFLCSHCERAKKNSFEMYMINVKIYWSCWLMTFSMWKCEISLFTSFGSVRSFERNIVKWWWKINTQIFLSLEFSVYWWDETVSTPINHENILTIRSEKMKISTFSPRSNEY